MVKLYNLATDLCFEKFTAEISPFPACLIPIIKPDDNICLISTLRYKQGNWNFLGYKWILFIYNDFKNYYQIFLSISKILTILGMIRYWIQAKLFGWYWPTFNNIHFGQTSSFFFFFFFFFFKKHDRCILQMEQFDTQKSRKSFRIVL